MAERVIDLDTHRARAMNAPPSSPLIDLRQNGIGDVVVACWIVHSAAAAGLAVRLNARRHAALAQRFGVEPPLLCNDDGADWCNTPGLGLQHEYATAARASQSRFDIWCASLGLPRLAPVRPSYRAAAEDTAWANAQWHEVDPSRRKPRLLLFPEAAWPVRVWPKAYFMDLAEQCAARGCAVIALGSSIAAVDFMPCHWWGGHGMERVAALATAARLAVANDSGPAHLAAALGTPTLVPSGPTRPDIVFAHEPNVQALALGEAELGCTGCHFDPARGYRAACASGGCQALMRLPPERVVQRALALLHEGARAPAPARPTQDRPAAG